MGREREDYRANLASIREKFPGAGMLTVEQVAEWLQVNRRTVTCIIERPRSPLVAVDVSCGKKNKVYRVSVEALARYSS